MCDKLCQLQVLYFQDFPPIRNEVEGKFFVYAQQHDHTEVRLPKQMFKVFTPWLATKYCRELRQKLIRDLETRSRKRTLAEHMATETMQNPPPAKLLITVHSCRFSHAASSFGGIKHAKFRFSRRSDKWKIDH